MYSNMGEGGGGEKTVFRRVADGLEERGHQVIRVLCDYDLSTGTYRKVGDDWHIALSAPPTLKAVFRPDFAYQFARSLYGLGSLLRKVEPDALNFHYYTLVALNFALLKPLFGFRFVLSCHGGGDMDVLQGVHHEQFLSFYHRQIL